MAAPEALLAADPPSYTFKPKNESGDTAKGWYVHLPPPFTANDVIIKDSGGKTLTKVRTIDRGRKTGVTVLFETDGAGVPDKGTDEIKLTLTKPLGKTGTSGFRDKDGVKGVPIGEATFDPPWTDNKGGMGGTPPKEGKKQKEPAPEEDMESVAVDAEPLDVVSDVSTLPLTEETVVSEDDDGGAVIGNDYPYTPEETNDELFGDWADGNEWDDSAEFGVDVLEPDFVDADSRLQLNAVPVVE